VTVIRDGKYISTNEVSQTNKDRLVADMVGRDIGAYYPKETIPVGGEVFRVEHLRQNGLVNDVSLHVNKGEIVGIAGLAGAGRTEFALAACGFTPPDGGKVLVEGKEIPLHSVTKSMDAGLVYVSEDRGKCGLVLDMSLNDNISLPQLRKFSRNMFVNRAKCARRRQGRDQAVRHQGPERGLRRDEPLRRQPAEGLRRQGHRAAAEDHHPRRADARRRRQREGRDLYSIISSFAKKELGILMISSEMPELLGMCDRIYVMRDGLVCGELTRAEATKEKILKLALNV
jgi:ABC-type sugar transport system ATPase subunit